MGAISALEWEEMGKKVWELSPFVSLPDLWGLSPTWDTNDRPASLPQSPSPRSGPKL